MKNKIGNVKDVMLWFSSLRAVGEAIYVRVGFGFQPRNEG